MDRLPRSSRARAVALVTTVVAVVVLATVVPVVLQGYRTGDDPGYDVDDLVPVREPADGEIDIEPRSETGVVLIDVAHDNRIELAEINPLLTTIAAAGYEVDLLEGGDDLDQALTRADAFVVIDPGVGYGDAEVNRVEAFVERGGRLMLVGEPTTAGVAGLEVVEETNQLTTLSSRFGFAFGEGHLFNMQENDGNHLNVLAGPVGDEAVTAGVGEVALYTATSIDIREGQPLLEASDGTRSVRSERPGTYPVAAVNGDVLALADGTFLRGGNVHVLDNERLVSNVVEFLVSGDKQRTLATYPAFVGADPTIAYTDAPLVGAAQALATDLRRTGREPSVTLRPAGVSPAQADVLVTTFDHLAARGPLGTGVSVGNGQVSLQEYRSATTGVIVVRAPADGYALVVVADTPARAQRAVEMLADGSLSNHLLTPRTAVVSTTGGGQPAA